MGTGVMAAAVHLAERLEVVLLAGLQHRQHVVVHVHLHLLPRRQLLAQPDVCLARVQFPPAVAVARAGSSWRLNS